MYIGSVDSSKLPYYFLTGTICWLVSLFTAVFLSDFQADVSSSLKILLCVVNNQAIRTDRHTENEEQQEYCKRNCLFCLLQDTPVTQYITDADS